MTLYDLVYRSDRIDRRRIFSAALFVVWFVAVLWLCYEHTVWRDEVRALSYALQGDTVFAMLKALHGEGHPALWYLLLRGAHAVVARPEVLQAVALAVAVAAMLLLAFRSPFSLPILLLMLLGRPGLVEYSVMARNYGISMLLLFLLAMVYQRSRHNGVLLGVLLFLLANCNAHSIILAGAFLGFWFLDIIGDDATRKPAYLVTFFLNAVIAAIGVVLAVKTMYPSINDAAAFYQPDEVDNAKIVAAFLLPATVFSDLATGSFALFHGTPPVNVTENFLTAMQYVGLSLLMFGSTLGLVRRPPALAAAVAALLGFAVLFRVVYPGLYRHQTLWLAFLVCMYWIAGRDPGAPRAGLGRLPWPRLRHGATIGYVLFIAMLAIQIPSGIGNAAAILAGSPPESRSRDLARLIAQRPDLRAATIVADPEYLLETLPYYLPNRTYLIREHRYGRIVVFTENARLRIDLDDILSDARVLAAASGQPVVILLQHRLDATFPAQRLLEGYNWALDMTPAQVIAFQSSTRLAASFAPALSDESYDVYVLGGADAAPPHPAKP